MSLGFAERRLVFGGAPPGTPWGTLGAIVQAALAPEGYRVDIEAEASRGRCPGLVHAGRIAFGATQSLLTRWAFAATHEYAGQPPLPRLRVLATILMPAWLGVAVRAESGIADLSDIVAALLPDLVLGARCALFQRVLQHHGLSRAAIDGRGGAILPMQHAESDERPEWFRTGGVDVISAFSTDGRIAAYDLVLLEDERAAIPRYDAVILVAPGFASKRANAGVLDALRALDGRIDADAIRSMNAQVDERGASPANVAAEFVSRQK